MLLDDPIGRPIPNSEGEKARRAAIDAERRATQEALDVAFRVEWPSINGADARKLISDHNLFAVTWATLDAVHYYTEEPPSPYPFTGDSVLTRSLYNNGGYRVLASWLAKLAT